MANRYWVGGTGTWATTTTNWSATSGGAGGASAPTAADSVFFDQAGTYTVTMTGALACLDITVSAGTVTFATGTTPTLAVSGSMSLAAGTVWNSTGAITFNSAATGRTIVTNGTTLNGPVTFNNATGGWSLGSALTLGVTMTTVLLAGSLSLNGFNLTTGAFTSSNTNTRSIDFGTSNIVLTHTTAATTVLSLATVTGFAYTGTGGFVSDASVVRTYTVGTTAGGTTTNVPSLTFTGSGSAIPVLTTGGRFNKLDFGTTAFTLAATSLFLNTLTLSSAGTFTNLTVTMFGTGTITPNGKSIAALTINHNDIPTGTTTLAGALTCTTYTQTVGVVDFATFNLTCSGAVAYTAGSLINIGTITCTTWTVTGTFALTQGTITPSVSFVLTSGSFTYTGGTLSPVPTFTHTAGTVTLDKAYALTATGAYTLTAGTLALGSNTLTTGSFNSNTANARTINFGTGKIVLNAATTSTIWNTATVTGLTVTGTRLVECIGGGTAVTKTVNTGALNEANAISFSFLETTGTVTYALTAASAFYNLIFNGVQTIANSAITIFGNFNNPTTNGVTVFSGGTGAWTFAGTGGSYNISPAVGLSGTGSTYVSSSSYLSVNGAQTALSFGTGDFTIESWVYLSGAPGTYAAIVETRNVSAAAYAFGVSSTLKLDFYYGTAGRVTSAGSVPIGRWSHCAVTKTGSTIRLFINGVLDATTGTFASAINATGTAPLIGALIDPLFFDGYLSNLRVVKGAVVYTGNFTPPTLAPLATSGAASVAAYPSTTNVNTSFAASTTSLLTCQSTTAFVDNSPNAFVITATGNPIASTVSPGATIYDFPWTFNGTGGTWAVQNDLAIGPARSLTWTNGTLDFNNKKLIGTNGITMTTGTFAVTNTGGTAVSTTVPITQASGTLNLSTNLISLSATGYTLTAGILNLNGFGLTTTVFSSSNANARSIAFGSSNIVLNAASGTALAMAITTNFTYTGTGGFTAAADIARTFTVGTTSGGLKENSPNLTFTGSGAAVQTLTTNSYFGTLNFGTTAFAVPAATVTLNSVILSTSGTYTGLSMIMFGPGSITHNGKTIAALTINNTGTTTLTGALTCTTYTHIAGTLDFVTFNLTCSGAAAYTAGTLSNIGIISCTTWTCNGTFTLAQGTITPSAGFVVAAGGFNYNGGTLSAVPAFTQNAGTVLFGKAYALTATGTYTLTAGTLNLNGFDLPVGAFSSSNANTRNIVFGANNIILATTTAAQTNLAMATATGFTYTGTGGFTAAADITRTFAFGTAGGTTTNSPKLTLTGSGTAVGTFASGSSFSTLDFGTTAFAVPATAISTNNLILSTGGTYTGMAVNMFGTGTINYNGKTTGALTVNSVSGTTTTVGPVSCAAFTVTSGTIDFATFSLTCTNAITGNTNAFAPAGTLNLSTITCATYTVNGALALTAGQSLTATTSFVLPSGSFTYNGGTLTTALFTHTLGTVTLGAALNIGATGTYNLVGGALNLGGFDLTVGAFSSSNANIRSVAFGTNNIVLVHTTAATTALAVATATGFTYTGAGGFRAAADVARTYVFGTTGGTSVISPNLTFTGSGVAAQTITTASWFNQLDFGTTAFNPGTTTINLNALTLSTGGTYTTLSATMVGTSVINTNGKTIAGFVVNTPTTATLGSNITCSTYTQTAGTIDYAGYTINSTGAVTVTTNSTFVGANVVCASFTVSAATFALVSGTINTPTFTLTSGTFDYTGGTLSSVTTFTHASGVVNLNSNLTLAATSTYTFTAGSLNLNNFTLAAGAFSSSNANGREIAFGTGNIVLAHTTAAQTVVAMADATNFNWTGTGGFRSDAAVTRTYAFGTTSGTFYNAPNLAITSGAAVPTFTNNSWFDVLDFTGSACAPAAATVYVDTLTLAAGGTYTGLIPVFTRTQTWTAQFGKQLGGIGVNRLFTTLTLDGTQTFTTTSVCLLQTGTLDLGGYDLTVGSFSSSGTATRSVVFGANNIVLNHSTAGQTVVAIADATNFGYSSISGGFASDAAVTRTFTFGTTGGNAFNAPNLLINSGAAAPTMTSGSWFNRLDFTGSACTPVASTINVNSLALSSGGTYTNVSVNARASGDIIPNGKSIAALTINHAEVGTTRLLGVLTCTTQTYTNGNVDFGNFNITGTGVLTYANGVFSNIGVVNCTDFVINGNFELITGTVTPSGTVTLNSGSFRYTGGTLSPVATFNHNAGAVTLGKSLVLAATGTYTLVSGALNLNGYNLTTGIFSSSNANARSVNFGTGNIVLAHTTAATTVLNITTATNFTTTGTGGFVSDAAVTRTFACAVSALAVDNINTPNLSITSGAAVPTITTNSYFNKLDFTGSTCTPAAAIVNVNTLILATGGTYTNLTPSFTRTQTWSMQFGKQLAGLGVNILGGTLTLDGTQTYTATSLCNLSRGTLALGGGDLTIGTFESGSTNTRAISFGNNNIVLATTAAGAVNINMPTATNFTYTGTGGFRAAADITRTLTFGTTGGTATNAPNLTFTGSGTSVQTLTSGGWFNRLDFGTTAFNPGTTALNLNSLTLSAGGTYTGLTATMNRVGTVVSNGKTVAALNINSFDTETYKIYTWTGSGSITFPASNAPPTVEYLVVGGGGAGGSTPLAADHRGGGGGAGGFVTGVISVIAGVYNVVVGAGGSAQANTVGANGESSLFGNITALGGGGGGMASTGIAGGSGGGGGAQSTAGNFSGGSATQPGSTSGGLGNNGGIGGTDSISYRNGGGGGGAGAAGQNAGIVPGVVNGGAGVSSGITGATVFYAGGGGGGGSTGVGGSGGGGNGSGSAGGSGGAGTANTGGGGAGGSSFGASGGAGGSGIVIIRYPASYASALATIGATATVVTAADIPGTVTMNGALTVTGTTTLTGGRLDLNGSTLTTGVFSGTGTNVRSIAFGTGNIVLASTTAGTTVLAMADATNFSYSGTGGFRSDAAITRTYSFGSSFGGDSSNAPNLSITSGAAVPTLTLNCSFKILDFTGSTCSPVSTGAGWIKVDTLILATGGTYTGLIPRFTRTQTWTSQYGKVLGGMGVFITEGGTLTLDGTQTFTATSSFVHGWGTLDLGGYDLTIGTYNANSAITKSINFGSKNIILATTTAAVLNLDLAIATGFSWTGTGGFVAAADITRTFTFGTTGGTSTNAPNLTFTGTGAAVQTITTGSWFNTLDLGLTAFTPVTTTLNLNNLILSTNAVSSGITAVMVGTGSISCNGASTQKTIAAFTINHAGTTTLTGINLITVATATTTLTSGTLNLNNFTLTTDIFSSSNTNTRSIQFGTGNIVLAHTTAAQTVLAMPIATNFTYTGTGGFTSALGVTRTFAFGSTAGGKSANAPNLSLTSGASIPTFASGSWFNNLNFTGSTSAPAAATVNVNSLVLAAGGTYTALTVNMVGTGAITNNGKTISALNVNSNNVTALVEYKVYKFNSSGSITFSTSNAPPTVEYLLVAGGGGGASTGSGAGAGGMLTGSVAVASNTAYSIAVGAGGAGGAQGAGDGANGENSSFSTVTATGGGGGVSHGNTVGKNGGSGGGGAVINAAGNPPGVAGRGIPGQGNDGGAGFSIGSWAGSCAGGGGAGAVGTAAGTGPTTGGDGLQSSFTGTATFYAGGGGGAPVTNGSAGGGGAGGGGLGNGAGPGFAGGTNLGGGGGGGSFSGGAYFAGGTGGSGVVVIRYPSNYADPLSTIGSPEMFTITGVPLAASSADVVTLNDALTTTGTATLTLGQLNLNNFVLTTGGLSSNNSNVRTIAFGSGSIALTGTAALAIADASNFTYTGTGALTSAMGAVRTFTFGTIAGGSAANALNLSLTSGASVPTITAGSWFKALNFTGTTSTPATTTVYVDTLTLATGGTYTGLTPILTRTQTWTSQFSKVLDGIGFNLSGGTLTLNGTQTYTATGSCNLIAGTIDLGGVNLTVGRFVSNNSNARAVAFGANNIVLATTVADALNLDMSTATNFTRTGTGGFVAAADITRQYAVGSNPNGAPTAANAPNLAFTGSGTAIQTILSGSWFGNLNFGTTGFAANPATVSVDTLTLSAAGTYFSFVPLFTRTQTWTPQSNKMLGGIGVNAAGATLTLGATQVYDTVTSKLIVNSGTINLAGNSLSFYDFESTGTGSRTITGAGTLDIYGNWSVGVGNGFDASGCTINMASSRFTKIFAGGGGTYGTLVQKSAAPLTITGSNTFENIQVSDDMITVTAPSSINFLLVAGGGGHQFGGDANTGNGGGGAGGLLYRTAYTIPTAVVTGRKTMTVTVGAGGGGANGNNSSINTVDNTVLFTTLGGGRGGLFQQNGIAGGSGGGGGGRNYGPPGDGGAGQQPGSASGGNGNNGGRCRTGDNGGGTAAGGGGGGAGTVGANGVQLQGGVGGAGLAIPIISSAKATSVGIGQVVSTNVWFAGGGGGQANGTGGAGGLGGGARGANSVYTGGGGIGNTESNADGSRNGKANTGGGSGGASTGFGGYGGTGGSGVIVFRHAQLVGYQAAVTGGCTVEYEGLDILYIFKSSGTITF